MKKLLWVFAMAMVLTILVSGSVMASVTVKVGYDYYGYNEIGGAETHVEAGLSGAVEIVNESDQIDWGFGVELEMKRNVKDTEAGFQFIPVYAMINYYTNPGNPSSPYITGRLGANLLVGDGNFKAGNSTSGGTYYALGAGYKFNENNRIEVVYSANNGTVGNDTFQYTRVSIMFGHTFR